MFDAISCNVKSMFISSFAIPVERGSKFSQTSAFLLFSPSFLKCSRKTWMAIWGWTCFPSVLLFSRFQYSLGFVDLRFRIFLLSSLKYNFSFLFINFLKLFTFLVAHRPFAFSFQDIFYFIVFVPLLNTFLVKPGSLLAFVLFSFWCALFQTNNYVFSVCYRCPPHTERPQQLRCFREVNASNEEYCRPSSVFD